MSNDIDPHVMLGAAIGHRRNAEANQELAEVLNTKLLQALQALDETKLALAIAKAQVGGYRAYLDLVKKTSPAIPALSDSGKRYADGTIKTRGAIAYEEAHDRIAREHRISDPKKYRIE